MRASVIQLKQVVFQRIVVNAPEPMEGSAPPEVAGFDFDGVQFQVALDAQPVPGKEGEATTNFVVALSVGIDQAEGKPVPYQVDVAALGLVEVAEVVEPAKRRDLALVNGASLVYGAIRELITTLTGRCVAGPLVLPTADFRDHSEIVSPPVVQGPPGADI